MLTHLKLRMKRKRINPFPYFSILENGNIKIVGVPAKESIVIPEYVTTIESGAFSMLIAVTFKTEYTEKPAGWADDFNSNLEVEWGVEINTETDK